MMAPLSPRVQAFFDEVTSTVSYLVSDPATGATALIDPVLDYAHRNGQTGTAGVDRVLATAREQGLTMQWILETHAHADHLSAAPHVRRLTGAPVAIGEHIREVQRLFAPIFNLTDVSGDGREFDRLLADGEVLALGELRIEVMHTPGHTPACVSYRIGDAVFVGDTLFMPDYGTARADFPGGSARQLFASIQRLLALPEDTRVFVCHDYKAPGRDHHAWESRIGVQRRENVHVNTEIGEDQFVAMREARDATLSAPALLLPSIQVNIRAGQWPQAESNGVHYLKIPLRTC